jgi:hypothetical protein
VAQLEPEAREPGAARVELALPALEVRLGDWIYSCGGAGGADAPATDPGRWPGSAPFQIGAASILLSCVHFLALCFVMHCYFGLAFSMKGTTANKNVVD